jgi:hypothetical protein
VPRRWPTLAGLGFAALIAFDLTSGVDLAPVLAASAAVYLGAAALQRPAAAWPLFFATAAVITVARLLDDRFEPTWVMLTASIGSWSAHSPSSASPWTPLWRWPS